MRSRLPWRGPASRSRSPGWRVAWVGPSVTEWLPPTRPSLVALRSNRNLARGRTGRGAPAKRCHEAIGTAKDRLGGTALLRHTHQLRSRPSAGSGGVRVPALRRRLPGVPTVDRLALRGCRAPHARRCRGTAADEAGSDGDDGRWAWGGAVDLFQ